MIEPKKYSGGVSEWKIVAPDAFMHFDGIWKTIKEMRDEQEAGEQNITEDAEFEIVQPKKIEDKND